MCRRRHGLLNTATTRDARALDLTTLCVDLAKAVLLAMGLLILVSAGAYTYTGQVDPAELPHEDLSRLSSVASVFGYASGLMFDDGVRRVRERFSALITLW